MKSQHGFTLLELMVAMAIFAMLAVAGWQVFDSVTRARERAQFHADNLAVLQYAYLQLQQDIGQIIPYQALSGQNSVTTNDAITDGQEKMPLPEPFMSLDGERLSFVRFADPDPRYQSSASMQHVEYVFADERLIRRQYSSIGRGTDNISLDSILLEGVTAARWQAYLPEISTKFPNKDSSSNNASLNSQFGQGAASVNGQPEIMLLPKGVAVTFTYQDIPITWQWALAPQPIPNNSKSNGNTNKNVANNPNDNGSGGNNSNGSTDSTTDGKVESNRSENSIENAPFGQ
ncbi:type II secretion system minor pseudopilin GspJ [Psychrobacter glacincola]|uniref:type II secretion system minor pseudopilin GspJ n=1 Tax=Psychrobacter glacincola TaxID=56810 RepID=UPI0039AFCD18